MAPKVTQQHLEARRDQILQAAFACFAREGFHQSTMQDICREAGLSTGAVYSYFGSKEEIIEASCQESQQGLPMIEAAREREDTLRAFGELVDFFFARLGDPDANVTVPVNIQLWSEALRNPLIRQHFRNNLDGLREALREMVVKAQGRHEVNPSLCPDAAARVMLSMWFGLVLQRGLDIDVDLWKYVEVVKAMLGGDFWQGQN